MAFCRKPIEKGLTVAENCLKWGTGGINIDESRVFRDKDDKAAGQKHQEEASGFAPGDESKMDYSKTKRTKK